MNKSKLPIKKIRKYLRELSVIVLGVAITLSVGIWINNRSEKRDMALYLNAIRMEMDENIKVIDKAIEYLHPAVKYEEYLRAHDKKSFNEDTLGYYATSCCYTIYKYTFKTNAFEMFKSSGIMRLVNDKELLLAIWDVYNSFISQNEILQWYFDTKWVHMEKDLLFVDRGKLNLDNLTNAAPMYNFYAIGLSTTAMKDCKNLLQDTKETISKLEKRNRKIIK
jgi:MoaA/NifB/PqqE/SkfB family radical SAM enzyme